MEERAEAARQVMERDARLKQNGGKDSDDAGGEGGGKEKGKYLITRNYYKVLAYYDNYHNYYTLTTIPLSYVSYVTQFPTIIITSIISLTTSNRLL